MNPLCTLLGIEKPVIQGPMSWISTAPLAAAVSEAGGLGVLGTGIGQPEFIQEQVSLIKQKTNKPYAINLGFHPRVFHEENFRTILEILKKEQVPVIHLDSLCDEQRRLEPDFAGPRIRALKELNLKVLVKVFTIRDAETARDAGADVLIAKGWEGGGHTTLQTTLVAVPQIADVAGIPVAASGGIADGRGMAAAMVLGAAGIEMGTAFLAAQEAEIHPKSRQAILDAGDFATVEVGFSTGEPCRQLRNGLTREIMEVESAYPQNLAKEKVLRLVTNSSRRGMLEGDVETNGALMAGQSVGMIRNIRSARDIINSTVEQCRAILRHAPDIEL